MDLASALRLVFKGKEITRHDWGGQATVKMHNGVLCIRGGMDASDPTKAKPQYSPWNIHQVDTEATDYIEYAPDGEAGGPSE